MLGMPHSSRRHAKQQHPVVPAFTISCIFPVLQELEPEEALVARKLSTVYERQTAQSATSRASLGAGGGNLGSSPAARLAAAGARPSSGAAAAAPRRSLPGGEEGSVSEESQAVLVVEGARDSSAPDAAWPASGRGGSSGGAAGGGPRLASVIVEGSEEGGSGVPSSEPSLDAVGAAQQPSLAHDLRSDWGVGMRDLSAVMRASVGMCQADDEGTAFSLWSMPMPLSASFTSQGPGASARRHSRCVRLGSTTCSGGSLTGRAAFHRCAAAGPCWL